MHTGRGLLADIQLSCNGSKGQNIVVTVCHFVRDKLLVTFAHGVIAAVVDKQIAFEGRLLVRDDHARRKAAMCSLDIPIAVVDADDYRVIVHIVHSLSFCRCAALKIDCLCTALYGKRQCCTPLYTDWSLILRLLCQIAVYTARKCGNRSTLHIKNADFAVK